jgi:UPF0176 protein
MERIILYYKFVPLGDPEAVRLWQRTLCEKLGLKGRILIAGHGINGTLGGDLKALKQYAKETKAYEAFKGMAFKWSDGGQEDFPKLVVKVRPEIVTFGTPDEIKVDQTGIVGGGKRLKPKQVHDLVAERGSDVIFFDGRNQHEAAVGKFKDAVVPAIDHTRDFVQELSGPKYDAIKDKPVVTYCTGGIRCEILSMLMKRRGFQEVYQLDGGIAKYGEEFGDDGLWEGSLYVFDARVTTKFSDRAKDIGDCIHCGAKTSRYENCADKTCNRLMLTCDDCHAQVKTCPQPA